MHKAVEQSCRHIHDFLCPPEHFPREKILAIVVKRIKLPAFDVALGTGLTYFDAQCLVYGRRDFQDMLKYEQNAVIVIRT